MSCKVASAGRLGEEEGKGEGERGAGGGVGGFRVGEWLRAPTTRPNLFFLVLLIQICIGTSLSLSIDFKMQ